MASLRNVTRNDVLGSIALLDRLGERRFLELTGYKRSTVYRIRHLGVSYPSKAILGHAAGLTPADLFGGVAQVVPALQALGFQVLRNRRPCPDVSVLRTVKAIRFEGESLYHRRTPTLVAEPVAVFASGSNRPGEVRGMAAAGIDVGVAAPELNEAAIQELLKLDGTDVNVFVDSGAFGEVQFSQAAGGFEVVRPISPDDWAGILSLYRRLAQGLGCQAWLVAPDRVGSQVETLARLARYATELRELRELGARILVPMQAGALSLAAFAARVDEVLGFGDWTPAMPCKKAATEPHVVARFVEARRPAHVHLLGLGARNVRVNQYLTPFTDGRTSVSLDANWITANVGRKAGLRPYTAARDAAKAVLGLAATAATVAEVALLAILG